MIEVNGAEFIVIPTEGFFDVFESFSNKLIPGKSVYANTLIVCKEHIETAGLENKWMKVKIILNHHNHKTIKIKRLMQIICVSDVCRNDIIVSEDDFYNLMKTQCPVYNIPYINNVSKISFHKASMKRPLKAKEVTVCLVKNMFSENFSILDSLMIEYFKHTRYLCKGDIFSVDVSKYLPELLLTKGNCNSRVYYFIVRDIVGPNYMDGNYENHYGYLVDDTVTLQQVTTQNSFLPPKYNIFKLCQNDDKFDFNKMIRPLVPSCLKRYFDELKDLFRPFLGHKLEELDLIPLFMLVGPVGCGKSSLLKSVTASLGLNYWNVECSSLLNGSTTGYNEARLREVFNKLDKNVPCLLHLNNFEAICEGHDGNEDIRLIGSFKRLVMNMNSISELPFIIVGTTSPNRIFDITGELMQFVLHTVNINISNGNSVAAINERAETIEWLCQAQCYCPKSVSKLSQQIAQSTSGFTLTDLSLLIAQASKEEYVERKKESNEDWDNSNSFITYNNFMKIVDKMNTESAGEVGAPKVPKVNWSDVGGHNAIKKEIVRSINTSSFGCGLRRSGLLLWGPPGTGKTLLAKAVATECGSTFLSVKGPELLNMYIGQSEKNVRQVFEKARTAAPCIVFFDELDSLAPNRGKSGDSCGVMDRVVSQLLAEMDGLQSNEGVFILGATNRPDLIDPALLRPGRLDKMLYVGPCQDTESKLNVLKALTKKFALSDDVDLKLIASKLPSHITGADLYSICYSAWQNAAKNCIKSKPICEKNSDVPIVIVSACDFETATNNSSVN